MIRDRIILVGQAPSRNGDPKTPLIGGRSGFFLQQLCGMSLLQYVRSFETVNVVEAWPGYSSSKGDLFPADEAKVKAEAKAASWHGRRVILLGKNVARAFGHNKTPLMTWTTDSRGFEVAVVPHPSGVSRWWNDPTNTERARAFLQSLQGERSASKT